MWHLTTFSGCTTTDLWSSVSRMRSPTTQQVAAVIEEAIKAAGLTVFATAKLSQIPPSTLDRKINRPDPFTVEELSLLAPVLGTTVSALLATAEAVAGAAA